MPRVNRRRFLISAAAAPLLAGPQPPASSSESQPFGPELQIVNDLGIGMAADVAVVGDTLFAVGGGVRGALYAADLRVPAKPKVISRFPGLGHVRQMIVRNGIAYITAREDSLHLIDVRNPVQPVLLSHYDTIELATGLALSGNVAFVACRQCGVELVDVSNPRHPAHLSTIRVGEAQSVASRNGYMYAGVWGTRELVVCDVHDPRRPVRVGSANLDGFGDGVTLRGSLCYVATGHHAAIPGNGRPQPNEPAFGRGHGLEIFDVSRPAAPRLLSRTKTPPRYRIFMDMWGVKVSGRYAYLADTYNGIFVIDVSDPSHPHFVAHRQLAEVPARGEGYVPAEGMVPSPVTNLAVGTDFIYVSGGYSDLHVVAAPGLASPVATEPDTPPVIRAASRPQPDPRYSVYQPGGQVHEITPWGKDQTGASRFVISAGNGGLKVVRFSKSADRIEPIAEYPTEGIAFGAATAGDTLYVAEGMGGLSIWRGAEKLALIGRYRVPEQSVKQVVVDPQGRYTLLHVGLNRLEIVDVSNPAAPKSVLTEGYLGLFYLRPLTATVDSLGGLVNWGNTGLFQYDVSGAAPPSKAAFRYPFPISGRNGAARYGDGWLVTFDGKYFLLRPGEQRSPQQIGLVGLAGRELFGKPILSGNTLFITDSYGGRAIALDVSNIAQPKLLGELELPDHPGYILEHNGLALIPGGYQGLLLWKYREGQ